MGLDLSFADLPPEPPEWLVQDMFARDQLIILAGEAGVGKSMLSYNLAICVAAGLPFLDHPTVRGKVLYFDEENSLPDLQTYFRWVRNGLGRPDLDQLKANLDIEHMSLITQDMLRYQRMAKLAATLKPLLIIVDTATPAFGIKDENSNSEASQAIQQLRKIQSIAHNKTTILILKHEKFAHDKSLERTIRGAKTWIGSTDSTIYHVSTPGRPPKNGFKTTHLVPGKRRAFGLQKELEITPRWIERGISLKCECFEVLS